MRYLIIEASGDNDALHEKALAVAVAAVEAVNHAPVRSSWVTTTEPPRPPAHQEDWPPHLRDDARPRQCSSCARKSWSAVEGEACGMPQPDGSTCAGVLGPVLR